MTSINQPKKKRQNRTVTLYLGQTVAEHENMISTEAGIQALIRRVETAEAGDIALEIWTARSTVGEGAKKGPVARPL